MVVTVTGADESIASDTLTYVHKSVERELEWQERGGYNKMV